MAQQEGQFLKAPRDRITLRSLAEAAASEAGKRIFLRDCPDRERWNGVEPRSLSFDAYFKAAGFLAAQLRTLGVEPGDSVLLLLPNCAEVPIVLLAAQLAGALPAIAPIDEKVDTLRAMAERCGATAILTTARVGEIALGDKARQVAAKLLAVRCVAGFGFDLPDGIVSLEGWSEEDVLATPPVDGRQDAPGLVTFSRENGAICAFVRTQAQMIAEALAVSTIMPLGEDGELVSLMQPGSAPSVAAGFVLPLLRMASVRLLGPFSSAAFARVMAEAENPHLLAPDHFVTQGAPEGIGKAAGLTAITRASGPAATLPPPGPQASALLVDLDERGMVALPAWPADGRLALGSPLAHPLPDLLPEGTPYLAWDGATWSGFGAARLIARPDAAAGKAA